jgi:hypothetical protein
MPRFFCLARFARAGLLRRFAPRNDGMGDFYRSRPPSLAVKPAFGRMHSIMPHFALRAS